MNRFRIKHVLAMAKKRKKDYTKLFLSGFGMGVVELIPGVSGGTIAFLVGIYGRLIGSIKQLTGVVLKFAVRFKFKEAWRAVPWHFLVPLMAGMLLAVISLARAISFLLSEYPVFTWSFFFGLVLASVIIIGRRIEQWSPKHVLLFAVAAVVALIVSISIPVETPATTLLFFLSGVIAISATILPGISGSFLLVIMGKYEQLLNAVADRDFFILGIFVLGAMVGLALFARILSWWLRNYYYSAVAALSGFIFGSLPSIWPWREEGVQVMPDAFDLSVISAILFAILGFAIILYIGKFNLDKDYKNEL